MNNLKKMKAMLLTSPGKWEVRDDVPIPKPGYGEVLCKIEAVAICGSDPAIVHGQRKGVWPPFYPFIAGHEWSGTVVELSDEVTDFQVGDRVVGEAHKGCGHCRNCLKGRYTLCLNYGRNDLGHRHYGFTTNGAYAQYNVYSVQSLTKLPDNVSFEEASMCDCFGGALHGLERAGVEPGDTVAVIGPGPFGLAAMKLSKAMGASDVIVVGREPRLSKAREMGDDAVVDFSKEDPAESVLRLTSGLGVDVVAECSGAPGTLEEAICMTTKGGSIVMLGVGSDDQKELIPVKDTTNNEITIYGSRANPNVTRTIVDMISAGRITVKDMITHRFSLDDVTEAFETFEKRKDGALKVLIFPNGIK